MSSKRARTFDLNDILAQTVKTAQERNKDNLEKRKRVTKSRRKFIIFYLFINFLNYFLSNKIRNP